MTNEKKPTYAQLGLVYKWLSWRIPTETAQKATKWLENHANRYQTSLEIKRLKELYDGFRLNEETCFDSEIWKRFKLESKQK